MTTDYGLVLSVYYPNPPYVWSINSNSYDSLVFSGGEKPTQEELDALWPATQAILHEREMWRQKVSAFQDAYSVQEQLISIMRGDTDKITEMLDAWDAL